MSGSFPSSPYAWLFDTPIFDVKNLLPRDDEPIVGIRRMADVEFKIEFVKDDTFKDLENQIAKVMAIAEQEESERLLQGCIGRPPGFDARRRAETIARTETARAYLANAYALMPAKALIVTREK